MSETVADHMLERLSSACGVQRIHGYPGDGINASAIMKGDPARRRIVSESLRRKLPEFLPGR